MTKRVDDLTIGEAKELNSMLSGFSEGETSKSDAHWKVGENYFICTVTRYHVGTLVAVTDKELVLRDASWIADAGRFEQAIKDGDLSEVEPFPDNELVIIGRGALIDAVRWVHKLPRNQK